MGLSDQILVVVSILEGRLFPKRPRHKIIVETKFDGETLSTDPTDHVGSPEFTTELAWELNRKSLHQHRLQRTPIKIQCYAVDLLTSQKEPVGYVILDLRTAQQQKQRPQWFPLLNSKYQRMKPEIKLLLSLEDDSQPKQIELSPGVTGTSQQQQKNQEPERPRSSSSPQLSPSHLDAFLNEEEGFYQIGPGGSQNSVFMFSVTIGLASNLAKLIPSSFALSDPKLSGGFYFYYALLGNDVTNEAFHDLLKPNFPAERASVRINSSLELLKSFFSHHAGIEIHLCSGDQSLGMAVVSLQSLLGADIHSLASPAVIEGLFTLRPAGHSQHQPASDTDKPTVGVSVSIKEDEQRDSAPGVSTVDATRGVTQARDRQMKLPSHVPRTREEVAGGSQQTAGIPVKQNTKESRPRGSKEDAGTLLSSPGHSAGALPTRPQSSTPGKTLAPEDAITTEPQRTSSTKKKTGQATQSSAPVPATAPLVTRPPIEEPTNHFCFSIDLRSIRDLDVTAPINCSLRYTYPFFGSSAPVITSPSVEVRRHMEVLLPKSFCAFDFAASPLLLQETFARVPLVVEVWHKDQMAGNLLVGVVRVSLEHVLAADRAGVVSNGLPGYRQIYSQRVPVITAQEPARKVGELHVVLGLEDLGPVNTQRLLAGTQSPSMSSSIDSSTSAIPLAHPQRTRPQQQPSITDPRETGEYKAALELEMWKEQQEELFQNQMQEREITQMKTLAEEWKRRDKERELLVTKKIEEYTQLEERLQQSIADLERREKQLAANEAEVMRRREELDREHERRLTEAREATRRMKEDCLHQMELERNKVKDLEQQKQRLVEQLYAAEKRIQDKENDLLSYKEQQLAKPEVKLESENNLLRMEKLELERKLEASNKSKIHYKQQWGRALRELARLKQQEQTAAKARLKKQERELEHMRMRYLAAEEKGVVKSEKEELEEIKQQIARLREQEEEKLRRAESLATSRMETSPDPRGAGASGSAALTPVNEEDEEIDSRIAKLIEERDTLLQTGVYTTEDRIIMELDRQIRAAIASKG